MLPATIVTILGLAAPTLGAGSKREYRIPYMHAHASSGVAGVAGCTLSFFLIDASFRIEDHFVNSTCSVSFPCNATRIASRARPIECGDDGQSSGSGGPWRLAFAITNFAGIRDYTLHLRSDILSAPGSPLHEARTNPLGGARDYRRSYARTCDDRSGACDIVFDNENVPVVAPFRSVFPEDDDIEDDDDDEDEDRETHIEGGAGGDGPRAAAAMPARRSGSVRH